MDIPPPPPPFVYLTNWADFHIYFGEEKKARRVVVVVHMGFIYSFMTSIEVFTAGDVMLLVPLAAG